MKKRIVVESEFVKVSAVLEIKASASPLAKDEREQIRDRLADLMLEGVSRLPFCATPLHKVTAK